MGGTTQVTRLAARLVPACPAADGPASPRPAAPLLRPLVVGAAVLRRPIAGAGPWRVSVSTDGRLMPLAPRSRDRLLEQVASSRRAGMAGRIAAALFTERDIASVSAFRWRRSGGPAGMVSDIYGWSLLYQLAGMAGTALVDDHERIAGLPAFYESAGELVDRLGHLASRGIPARPLALVTLPEDFRLDEDGRSRNRFLPGASCRRPAGLDWCVGP